jgi:O-antigen ligase
VREPVSTVPIGGSDWRGRLIFGLLTVFLLGFYLLPSNRDLGSTPHDLLFYFGVLPVFLLFGGRELGRMIQRRDGGDRLLLFGLAFILYLGASACWTRGDRELSPLTVVLTTLATAVFLIGSSEVLSQRRWRQLRVMVVGAATAVAAISMIAYVLGGNSYLGRLKSFLHFEHPNLFAHYMGFAALICLLRVLELRRSGKGRIAPWAAAGLILSAALVLTQGRSAMVAFALASSVAVFANRDRKVVAGVALVLMAVTLGFLITGSAWGPSLLDRGDAGRGIIYRSLIERMDGRWVTGVGLAASDDVEFPAGSWDFPKGFTMPHSHSAFVATAYHGGVVGLGLLLVLVGVAGRRAWRTARERGDPTGLVLLLFGVVCLAPDGHRLVSNPHLSSWLIFWLPVAWIISAGRWDGPGLVSPRVDELPPVSRVAVLPTPLFWILAALFFGLRLLHLGAEIDTPNMWRQCDTAQYIRAFYEDGIDLLQPSVCWLGDHRTTILEFPLPEAVAAVGYHVFGPHHVVARAVFLLFFLGSAFFAYRFVCEVVGRRLARMTVLIYLVMPLSLFYSRAIHIDFSALFFAYGMATFFAVGLRRESARWMWAGACFAAVALMIKAPYVLPVVPPLGVLVFRDHKWRFVLRSLPQLALPVLVFWFWEVHVHAVNSAAPDWDFIPHYRKMVQSWGWYFGTLAQRLDPRIWLFLGQRFWSEVTGALGVVPLLVGLVAMIRQRSWLLLSWCAGAVLMLLVFFNLCVVHNYYLIPFLAPAACLIAVGILWLVDEVGLRRIGRVVMAAGLLLLLAAEYIRYAEGHYYGVLADVIEGGRVIEEHTPEGSLLVVSRGDFDCRSPHLLYSAHRYGWSITERDLQPDLLEKLQDLGADHLATIRIGEPEGDLALWLAAFDERVIELDSTKADLYLYDLRPTP